MKRTGLRWPPIGKWAYIVRWPYIALIIVAAAGLSYMAKTRLNIDTDITESLPLHDRVISDARYVMLHHPMKDRIIIDLSNDKQTTDALAEGAAFVEQRLSESGLFSSVGTSEYQSVFPALISHIIENMPLLFTEEELADKIGPLLEPAMVRKVLLENYSHLFYLEGIGQSRFMTDDPLGFKNFILARLSHLAPAKNIQVSQGHLLSPDGKHILITAEPKGSGADTALSRKITALIAECGLDINKTFKPQGIGFTLTPVGAYRAALDNEETARNDTRTAVVLATIGIAILLFIGFPRPFIGILALVPAVLGTIAAAFVYSLFSNKISILAIGFGSTIISFTVDYGITYLLFLDRPYETRGFEATKEVWSLGLLAMLTTAAGFAFLFISGFSALSQIGYFTALGVVFTYMFVHLLFPVVFPTMPPAKRPGMIQLQNFVDTIMSGRSRYKAFAALAFCAVMLLFARPEFRVDLASMNTVSSDTIKAEKLVASIWGNVFNKIYLMTEARSIEELQEKGDQLTEELKMDIRNGALSSAFVPSMIFPGREMAEKNLAAWNRFWTPDRVAALKRRIIESSKDIGFKSTAFENFYKMLAGKKYSSRAIPEKYFSLLSMHRVPENNTWAQFSVVTPGKQYRAEAFDSKITQAGLAKLFDPGLFSDKLGSILLSGFIKMALIVGFVTILVALLYLLDLKLTLIAMAPTLFSLICTFGTMNILRQQMGIPTIMVTVIVIGMGTDYALYIVRAYQRYMDEANPSMGLIRMTVFLSAASTMIGFGALAFANHALLRSAGLTLFLGIGYSFVGTIMIVPPLLRRLIVSGALPRKDFIPGSEQHAARVRWHYRFMEPYPRFFAYFKMKFDPMFSELHEFMRAPGTILDIGTGYGVPAVWLLELFPGASVYGLEPDEKRCRIASMAIGGRGRITHGKAPDLPDIPGTAEVVLAIDMIHYLSDEELSLFFDGIRNKCSAKSALIIRATIPRKTTPTMLRSIELLWIKMKHLTIRYRTEEEIAAAAAHAGFSVSVSNSSNTRREEKWFICKPKGKKNAGRPKTSS
jgi:uncharacterized protein